MDNDPKLPSVIDTAADGNSLRKPAIFSQENLVLDEAQFRLFADNLPTLCWMANADGYIFWYNRKWHEYCGSTAEEMEGWGWQSVHDPEMLPSVLQRWVKSIATGEPFEMTFPLRSAAGVYHPFLTRINPVRDEHGYVKWWFGVNTDISAQIVVEQRLERANSKLLQIAAEREALLSQMTEGVIVTDPQGVIKFVNDAAVALHGVARLDVPPEEYAETYSLFTTDGRPHPEETLPLTRAIRNLETVVDAHWLIRRPDGTEILAIGNARPFYDGEGGILGAVLTIRDDTQRQVIATALAEAVEAKDVLLHEVNHRVKNSLQLVTSLLMLQASQAQSPEIKRHLLDARSRISVVAGVHKRLYTSAQHDRVELATYLRELGEETVKALNNENAVAFAFYSRQEIIVALDQAVPIALLVS
jgi:PAS domain S-box-containing protein